MIGSLTGEVIHRDALWLILDVGGVGYQISIPRQVTARVGDTLRLFCSHQLREDSSNLYGFMTLAERLVFELLLTVSGIGPKSALGVMSTASISQIEEAIIRNDPTLFEGVSGLGKKSAAKIIVELKSKIGGTGSLLPSDQGEDNEFISALESLGYRRVEILPLMRNLPTDLTTLQAQIRWALKELA